LGNDGDKAAAAGMLVFNTGYKLDGPGLYVWTGTGWQAVNPINYEECDVPEKPASITFSKTSVPVNTLFTATASLTTVDSYEWTFPDGFEIAGEANTRSIILKAKREDNFPASGITVKAVNVCGASEATTGTGTIIVTAQQETPAKPTLTLPATGTYLDPGDEFTITCGDVGANEYIWTLPDGITPVDENITLVESTYTTTTNSITVKAEEGTYEAYTFKVKAKNTQASDDAKGSGGRVVAKSCSGPPSEAYLGSFRGQTYLQDATFSIFLVIATEGPVDYQWTLPKGLSIVSGNGTMQITISCDRPGIYNGSDIKVRVENKCKPAVDVSGSGTFTVVGNKGVKGTVTGTSDTVYTTYKYPNGLGTWMTQNSKEGNPMYTKYENNATGVTHEIGERGYYYKYGELDQGCPNEWILPSSTHYNDLWAYLKTLSVVNEQNEKWLTQLAGVINTTTGNGNYWDGQTRFHSSDDGDSTAFRVSSNGTYDVPTVVKGHTMSVRCIKNSCDEAPANVRFMRHLPIVVAKDGIDTIKLSYRTFGTDTTVTWNIADDKVEIIDSTKTYAVLKYKAVGTFDWSNLTCTISNSCGPTIIEGNGECEVLSSASTAGPVVECGTNRYNTWQFPDNLGLWTVDYLKENPALATSHPDEEEVETSAYYYGLETAAIACRALGDGWRLPTVDEALKTFQFWLSSWAGGGMNFRPPWSLRFTGDGTPITLSKNQRLSTSWTSTAVVVYTQYDVEGINVRISNNLPTADYWYPTLCISKP
ncbi:MAG: hypothetical protein LBS08_05395, partial [Candidatus Symbiothrix sp.]|nr:hypothetical protein [Candidatus Symbiothrix sp.]